MSNADVAGGEIAQPRQVVSSLLRRMPDSPLALDAAISHDGGAEQFWDAAAMTPQ